MFTLPFVWAGGARRLSSKSGLPFLRVLKVFSDPLNTQPYLAR